MLRLLKELVRPLRVRVYRNRFERRHRQRCYRDNAQAALKLIERYGLENPTGLYDEYIKDLKQYQFSFVEWHFLYRLSGKPAEYKEQFISSLEAQRYYRKYIEDSVRQLFIDKSVFLNKFSHYIRRTVADCRSGITKEVFQDKFYCKDIIVKPVFGSLGIGVFKTSYNEIEQKGIDAFMAKAKEYGYVMEECITGCEELQRFHPASLNTVRVITCVDGDEIRVFSSFVRFGVGNSIVDNVHTGGIYCSIDVNDGIIDSSGFDQYGKEYDEHPDTHLIFAGTRIPHWHDIETSCIESHRLVKTPIIGWDVCINARDEVEFIEGNHGPDLDLLQTPHKRGLASEFIRIISSQQA